MCTLHTPQNALDMIGLHIYADDLVIILTVNGVNILVIVSKDQLKN